MREKKGIVLLEGRRLIMDALDAGAKIESIYFSKVNTIRWVEKILKLRWYLMSSFLNQQPHLPTNKSIWVLFLQ